MSPNTRYRGKRVINELHQQHELLHLRSSASERQKVSSQASLDAELDEALTLFSNSINIRTSTPNVGENPVGSDRLASETVTADKKKGRGPTLMPKVWGFQPEKRMAISFNELGQPNDIKRKSSLAGFLGSIARNPRFCPLHYNDWRKMPSSYKEDMLKLVKARFDLPPGEDPYILESINKKWKSWKNRVKSSSFKIDLPNDLQQRNLPDRVDVDQFKALVEHWSSDKSKKISEKNKETRAKLEDHHHMGQRGYAVTREIMKEELGRYPTRAEVYEKSYLKPDGLPASDSILESIIATEVEGN